MRKSKNQPELEIAKPFESGFKLKITNLRKTAYPANPTESDYYGFKPGDFIYKGSWPNRIYEVTHITREALADYTYNHLSANLINKNGISRDVKAKDLLESYKKTGNFGMCKVYMKSVVSGDKIPKKPRTTSFLELMCIRSVSYSNYYTKTDLQTLIQQRDNSIGYAERRKKAINKQIDKHNSIKQALLEIMQRKFPVPETQIVVAKEPHIIEQVMALADEPYNDPLSTGGEMHI